MKFTICFRNLKLPGAASSRVPPGATPAPGPAPRASPVAAAAPAGTEGKVTE